MCRKFGWDPRKPIVGFYGSNWYDWPHQLGMTQFRDFLDWTHATYQSSCTNNSANWLFKSHPAEDWFGGVSLADVLGGFGGVPHVALPKKLEQRSRDAIDRCVGDLSRHRRHRIRGPR